MTMRTLIVDLTQESLEWTTTPDELVRDYLGGRGLGVRYLYDHLGAGTDPLGPDNILTMWTSPILGAGPISMVKICAVTKSPATNTILMSLMGGQFGPELRAAGADALIFKGVAGHPVFLAIEGGEASLRPAEHLWGKTTRETAGILKQELGLRKLEVASIGQAGENLVTFASIMHGGDAFGRGGIGAVMGSKRLKAIAASGSRRPGIADPERFRNLVKRISKGYQESKPIELFGATGTTGHVDNLNLRRIYPTRNFRDGQYEDYELVDADRLYENFVTKRVTCRGCSVRCRREAEVQTGPYAGVHTEGPEYETLWGFSGNCGNNSLEAVIAANDICLEHGMDSISASAVISFAMECFEEGILSTEDTGGLALNFGNHAAMIQLLHLIARREGIGEILAQGSRRAAEIIGRGSADYAMQVKGLELAGYDPRTAKGMALGYATSPRGGCHERGYLVREVLGAPPPLDQYAYEGKGELVKEAQDQVAIKDSLGFCVLSSAGTTLDDMAAMFSAATGMERTVEDLMQAGERICNLERQFNLREGFTRADDTLPRRFIKEAIPGSDGKLHTVDLQRLLSEYYAARGWTDEGEPRQETLERLGLESPA